MEMGGSQAFRNRHDTHNGGNGLDNSTVNQMVGANLIYHDGGTVSIAYDPSDVFNRPYYNYANPLSGRFLIYRVYWDASSMRFTVVDGGVERDLYAAPFPLGPGAQEMREPFYLIANLAIGGAFTDCYRLGDPGSGAPISMPLPATMYVDYVRVYQWNGQGQVTFGPPTARNGRFGLFTDTTPTHSAVVPGVTSDIYAWENTLISGSIPPFEGSNVMTWRTNAKGWFGAGIMSRQPINLFDLGDGYLKLRIKIPANVTFKIGVIDSWGNQFYTQFPANTTRYGLVRDGNWGQVTLPVSAVRGPAIDLRMMAYEFVILEENGTACEFALDDIYWEDANVVGVEDTEASPALRLSNAPNPFTSSTELRFTLPAAAPYQIAVFDVSGRRVTGFTGIGRAGANAVRWNGTDEQGREVGAGVYYYHLVSGGQATTRKIALSR